MFFDYLPESLICILFIHFKLCSKVVALSFVRDILGPIRMRLQIQSFNEEKCHLTPTLEGEIYFSFSRIEGYIFLSIGGRPNHWVICLHGRHIINAILKAYIQLMGVPEIPISTTVCELIRSLSSIIQTICKKSSYRQYAQIYRIKCERSLLAY